MCEPIYKRNKLWQDDVVDKSEQRSIPQRRVGHVSAVVQGRGIRF